MGILPQHTQLSRPSGVGPATLTIATMPARTASGKASQRSTSRAKSGDFWAKSAKQDAKTLSFSRIALPEGVESEDVTD
jgi:hypothetical protein